METVANAVSGTSCRSMFRYMMSTSSRSLSTTSDRLSGSSFDRSLSSAQRMRFSSRSGCRTVAKLCRSTGGLPGAPVPGSAASSHFSAAVAKVRSRESRPVGGTRLFFCLAMKPRR